MERLTVEQLEQFFDESGMSEEQAVKYVDEIVKIDESIEKLSEVSKALLPLKPAKKLLEIANINYKDMEYLEVRAQATAILVKSFLPQEKELTQVLQPT